MMRTLYRMVTQKLKLAYQWVFGILLAPNHFRVGLASRLHWALRGYVPDQIALYHLNEGTAEEYLSEFDWYRSRVIDEPYATMLNNKVLCSKMLSSLTNVPEVLFFVQKGHIVCPAHPKRWATPDEVLDAIRTAGKVFIKPISSGKGRGVHLIECHEDEFAIDYQVTEATHVRQLLQGNDWHICAYAQQSSFLETIFDRSTNTIRAITLRDHGTGEYRMLFAVLRIGGADTGPVDNGSQGGLVAKIDLETGELSCARSIQQDVCFSCHPDTGAHIEGERIPEWECVRDEVVSLAEKLPFLEFVAWDILLTDEGFTVIEANASSGVNIVQIWGGQRQGALGVFYRAHGAIR